MQLYTKDAEIRVESGIFCLGEDDVECKWIREHFPGHFHDKMTVDPQEYKSVRGMQNRDSSL